MFYSKCHPIYTRARRALPPLPTASSLTWREERLAARGREPWALDEGALGVEAVVGERAHGLAVPRVVHGHALGVGGADAAVRLSVLPAHWLRRPAERLQHTATPKRHFGPDAQTAQ